MTGQRRHRQPSASYQIRVRGHPGPATLRAFAALHVQTQAHDTLPRGRTVGAGLWPRGPAIAPYAAAACHFAGRV